MRLKVVSRGYYALRYFLSIAVAVFITLSIGLPKGQMLLFLVVFGLAVFLVIIATKNIDKGEVELNILDEGISVKWIKQFHFIHRQSRTYKWSEIEDYVFQPDQNFDLFRIRMTDKTKIKFNLKETTEEFTNFYTDFESKAKQVSQLDGKLKIKKGKTVYETTCALVGAIVLGVMIIGLIVTILFVKPKGTPNYAMLIFSVMGGLFFIIQVYNHRRNK